MRDNIRKYKANQHQPKNIQSQSPPQRKLLKKLENTHKEGANKYEFSLQDNYVPVEQKEEVQDFRVEIERRFQKSIPNKIYIFPLHNDHDYMSESETDRDDSLSSLKHVTVYELAAQNQQKRLTSRAMQKSHTIDLQYNCEKSGFLSSNTQRNQNDEDRSFSDWEFEGDDYSIPIESRIRDKSSITYKKLMQLLENTKMFSHNSTNSNLRNENEHDVYKTYDAGNRSETTRGAGKPFLIQNILNEKSGTNTNVTTQVSTSDTHKNYANHSHINSDRYKPVERNIKSAGRNGHINNTKKAQSQDKPVIRQDYDSSIERNGHNTGNMSSKG